VASEQDFNVLMFQSNELSHYEKKGIETFLRSRVDGVLASLSKETTDLSHFKKIRKRGVPLVLFDRANDRLGVPCVVVNDYQGAYNATKHLVEQGCRRIAHIAGQQHVAIFKERLRGYKDALRDCQFPMDESMIVYGEVTIESGRTCMDQLLSMREVPDGIFAVEDFTALGAMQALKSAGISIPQDVALIGFANETFGKYISPSLSTVDQQTIRMGEEAARLFFELSAHGDFYQSQPCKRMLEPQLIFRASSSKQKDKP